MTKTQMIDHLIVNGCGCWNEEDRDTLDDFSEKKLRKLVANANKHNELVVVNEAVSNGLTLDGNTISLEVENGELSINSGDLGKVARRKMLNAMSDAELTAELKNRREKAKNAGKDDMGGAGDDEEDDDEEGRPNLPPKSTDAVGKGAKNMANPTAENAASRLTSEEQEDIAFARAVRNRRKQQFVTKLVANLGGEEQKRVANELGQKPISELETLVKLLAVNQEPATPDNDGEETFNWEGAATPTNVQNAEPLRGSPMGLPEWDFSTPAK